MIWKTNSEQRFSSLSNPQFDTPRVLGPTRVPADRPAELRVIPAAEMPRALIEAWQSLRNSNPSLSSPYFDYRFTQSVSRVRSDVVVAYTIRGDRISEILPYQTKGPQQMGPVGGMLNDVNGVISQTGAVSKLLPMLMTKMNFCSFPFHGLINAEAEMERFQFRRIKSYHLDLSEGWEPYRHWVRANSSTVTRQGQKSRGLARDIGPLRFELDVREPALLEHLIQLKRAKYQRSKTFDILSVDWAANLLREIYQLQEPNFRGLLSAIWAGDEVVAMHFGMLTDNILHYWFPVYDPMFARYSAGTQLLLSVAQAASERGVTKIDLGFGDDPYKLKFSNGTEWLSCGEVTMSRLAFKIARRKYFLRHQLKAMPMKPLAKSVLRKMFPGFGGWNFR